MSIITVQTTISRKYLMNKTKFDLASMYLDLLTEKEKLESRLVSLEAVTQAARKWWDAECEYSSQCRAQEEEAWTPKQWDIWRRWVDAGVNLGLAVQALDALAAAQEQPQNAQAESEAGNGV